MLSYPIVHVRFVIGYRLEIVVVVVVVVVVVAVPISKRLHWKP